MTQLIGHSHLLTDLSGLDFEDCYPKREEVIIEDTTINFIIHRLSSNQPLFLESRSLRPGTGQAASFFPLRNYSATWIIY